MAVVGVVREIWRYPVKSMVGERLSACRIDDRGLVGDRGWAVRDEEAREICGGKKIPALMQCTAAYCSEPVGDEIPPVTITLPDGQRGRSDDGAMEQALSKALGRRVTLWPLQPASNLDHYRLAHPVTSEEIRRQLAIEADEPDPDFSELPLRTLLKLRVFATPPGTYFDAYPLHLLTTASLEAMQRIGPKGNFDRRRFRPNLLIETTEEIRGTAEFEWCGGILKIGEAAVRCEAKTIRCSMPARPQPGLEEDKDVIKTIRDHAARHLGVYATVIKPGSVKTGDVVELSFPRFRETRKAYGNAKKSIKRTLIKWFPS